MAEALGRCPLPDGKIYHFNVIYNHARSPLSVTPDTRLSRAFTEKVVATLESLGYVNCYFHDRDCLPGRNVFTELFRVVEGSDYTIVVLTAGFVRDCWSRYTQQSTFKKLLDQGQSYKFLPLSVALRESDLPEELTTEHVLCFDENWESDASAWHRLSRVFTENIPVPEVTRGQDLPSTEPIQETNTPDGQVNSPGRDDLDHASELPEPQGEGQLGSVLNQDQSLGNTEVPVGRSHFANVNESNRENTRVTDETDSGRTDRVDEASDRVREDETHCGNDPQRETLGGPSNAQSSSDHAQDEVYFRHSRDHPVNDVEQDGSVSERNRERQNTGRQNNESQDIENQNTELQNIENPATTSQNTEHQNIESQDITIQNIKTQNKGSQDIGSHIADFQITETQNTENQITNSQITDGISMDLSRRQFIKSNREQQGKTSQTYPEHYRERGPGAGEWSTSMQGRGTVSRKDDWETGAQNISSHSLPSTSLEEDQGDLESSVVTRLERTGMAGFRDDLVQTRRRSTDDTSEKRIKEGRYRYSVDITPSSHYSTQKQDMEMFVHDVDQTKLKISESETQKDSSNQRQVFAPANQNVSPRDKSSTGSHNGMSDVSSKHPVHHQTITDQTRHPIETTSTLNQHVTKVDEASELEAVLFRASLPSLDDSGISESGSWSNEARTDPESLQDSSPEETFSGDNTYGQRLLTSSERGTPDGSVQEIKTTEHVQSRLKENVDKPEADVEVPRTDACNYHGEPNASVAAGRLRVSNQDDLSAAKASENDSSFVDQTTSLEVLNSSGRTQTDTRSLLKKQSVTDTISLTNDALEQFQTIRASTALTSSSEKTASSQKATLFDDISQDHLKSRQTNTESPEKHDTMDKTSEECLTHQDPPGDSRRDDEYSRNDNVSTVTEPSSTMPGTDTSFAPDTHVDHSTSSTAAGDWSESSGAPRSTPNVESDSAASKPRHTTWLLPACKLIIHLITRAENPFLI
ncbi:serine-rich adhesin for platelets-like [Haliotis asinina]|uniref:serine-rich adhesin for platelets-like n=1 Tax=Haliotis asinina TaxID=109174 RepID=UPI0035327EAF